VSMIWSSDEMLVMLVILFRWRWDRRVTSGGIIETVIYVAMLCGQ